MDISRGWVVATGSLAAALAAAGAVAHHSITAHYDRSAATTIEGVVTEVVMRNPHSLLRLDVADASGGTEEWALEMDDVEDMAEQGVTSETLRTGDRLIVFGFPARDGSNALHIERFRRPSDGLEYEDD